MEIFVKLTYLVALLMCVMCQEDPLAKLRLTLPGEPGVDYPILSSIQDTQFDCEGKTFGGFYADPDTDCQGYHVCLQDPNNSNRMYPIPFLCPNGTIFNQEVFTCEWWFNVDCTLATSFYSKNEGLFATSVGVSGGDSCPALSPLPSSDCEGSVSSCWSPGQPDGDCPDFGLCCFDGCSNTCGEAQAQVKAVPQTLPTTTTEGYDYEPPEVTLPVRPKKITITTKRTTTPKRITTTKRTTTPKRITTTKRTTTPERITTTKRTTKTVKTTTELELLYGAPRQGRNLSNRRRTKKRNRNQL